jgi:pimeloyl-ACP methyl ester carboxylesterase
MSTGGGAERAFEAVTPDGARLAARLAGTGRALLLVSGLGGTAGFWSQSAAVLAGAHTVIRFDQRGIAGSTRGEAACSIDQLARDCLTVLDAAGIERAVVLGHSTGGCIGQALARIAPQRLDGLILSATWLKPSRYMAGLFGARRAMLETCPQAYAATAALLAYPPDWLERNWQMFEAATATPPSGEAARTIVRERIDALLAFDGSADAASIAAPCLVLGARDDVIVPAFLQDELAAALPGCTQIMLETGGHFFPVSRTQDFAATVAGWTGRLE